MIIILYGATQLGNDILVKEWEYNYGLFGEATNTLENLFRDYIGESLGLIKMQQINYNTYVIKDRTTDDLKICSDKFKEKAEEIKRYKNDKRITNENGGVCCFYKHYFNTNNMFLPVDIDMLSF